MNKESLESIDKLLRVSESIVEIYQEMSALEKEGKENTTKYQTVIERLKTTLFLEENIIKNIPRDPKLIMEIERKIISENKHVISADLSELIINKDYNSLRISRVFSRIKTIILQDSKACLASLIKSQLPEYILRALDDIDIESSMDSPELQKCIKAIELDLSIKRDMSTLIYKLIEQEKSLLKNNEIKNNLIDYKYALIILDNKLESFLVNNLFKPEEFYIEREFTRTLLRLPKEILQYRIDTVCMETLKNELLRILKTKDYEYEVIEKESEMLFRSLIFRSALQELSVEEQMDYTSSIIETFEKHSHTRESRQNSKSEELIRKSFKQIKRDSGVCSRLTLKI